MQTGNTDFFQRNVLNKACFQNDIAFGKSKDLSKRTQSDKVLRDKAFKITSDPKYGGYQRGQLQWFKIFFDKKSSGKVMLMNQIISSQMNFISKLLENVREEKFIHHLKIV